MPAVVVVMRQPQGIFVIDGFQRISKRAVAVEKLSFQGLVEPFDLAVLLWSVGLVLDDLYAVGGQAVFFKFFPVAVVYSQALDYEWYAPHQPVDKGYGIVRGLPVIAPAVCVSGAAIYG